MGLCTLFNWFVSSLLDYLKSYLESESRLPTSKFLGSYCNKLNKIKKMGLVRVDNCSVPENLLNNSVQSSMKSNILWVTPYVG